MVWVGHLWPKWVGQLRQSKLLFHLEICSNKKIAGLQGSTLFDHRMTTGFGPFELPTTTERVGHSPPKACFI